jgi:acetyltransferase
VSEAACEKAIETSDGALEVSCAADVMLESSWRREARTRSGREYAIRPIRADDAQRDRDFLVRLSAESRYRRMMGSLREPSPSLIDRFVHVDYRGSMAFVAVINQGTAETIIGVARYALEPGTDHGEFAIAVADEWQSQGIGTALLRVLFEYARLQGSHRLNGLVLSSNERMLDLARKQLMTLRRIPSECTVEVTKDL